MNIDGTNSYEISIIIQEPGAFLASDSATINGVSYVKGDLIKQAYIDVGGGTYQLQDIDTSEKASDAKASLVVGDSILLNWKDNFRVETYPVDKATTGTGSQDRIHLGFSGTAFSSVPLREDIWVLTEKTPEGTTVAGSGKEYKVLSTSQDDNNQYEISAVEHYDSKYSSIEEEFTTYVSEPLARTFKSTDIIPPPEDVWVQVVLTEHEDHENVKIHYTPALGDFADVVQPDGTVTQERKDLYYKGVPRVEITHNIPDPLRPSPIQVAQQDASPSYLFQDVEPGTYEVQVRTVGPNGAKSLAVRRTFEVTSRFRNRKAGYFPEAAHAGGSSNKGTEIV